MSRTIRRKNNPHPRFGGPCFAATYHYLSDYVYPRYPDFSDFETYFRYWYHVYGESRSNSSYGTSSWQRKVIKSKHRNIEKAKMHRYLRGLAEDVIPQEFPKRPPWTW